VSQKKLICTSVSGEDVRGKPMWIVNLSNGEVAYQSDDDPQMENHNSWLCLKKYAEENGLYIKDMVLRFRDHVEVVGSGAKAYYFVHMILGNFIGYNQLFYNTGVLVGDTIKVNQWIIPELMVLETSTKIISDPHVTDSLITGVPTS
jgi:hypothetical protein